MTYHDMELAERLLLALLDQGAVPAGDRRNIRNLARTLYQGAARRRDSTTDRQKRIARADRMNSNALRARMGKRHYLDPDNPARCACGAKSTYTKPGKPGDDAGWWVPDEASTTCDLTGWELA